MIVRKQCCTGKRVNGFRSFGAAINDFDTFIKGVVGAGYNQDKMMLVVSEWLCGDSTRQNNYRPWFDSMEAVLDEMGAEAQLTLAMFTVVAKMLVRTSTRHPASSCMGVTGGTSGGMSVEDMITKGESLTKSVIDLFDGDKGEQPVTNTPPGTTPPGGKQDTKKPATSWMTFVAIGAAGLAAVMLLPKKK